MIKRKMIILIIILLIIISVGVYFMFNYNPGSLRYVMRKLDSYLETEYKYISTYKSSEPNIEGIMPVIYLFEDINGIEFDVVAFPPFGDYDSSQPGYPRCSYLTAYYESNKESIKKNLQCEIPITCVNNGFYSAFDLRISSYDEIGIIAPYIEKALNTFPPLISENYAGSASDKFEFYIPEISVWTSDKNQIISVFNFRLVKGQTPWTQEEILYKLRIDYEEQVTK